MWESYSLSGSCSSLSGFGVSRWPWRISAAALALSLAACPPVAPAFALDGSEEVGEETAAFVETQETQQGTQVPTEAEGVTSDAGEDDADSGSIAGGVGIGVGAAVHDGEQPTGEEAKGTGDVAYADDETEVREFNPETPEGVKFAVAGVCGGFVLGSIFTRSWGRWGYGRIAADG